MSSEQFLKLSQQYFSYMTFRAKQENMEHKLPINFYYDNLCSGCSHFFGIYHDNENITHDTQNPEAYKKYLLSLQPISNEDICSVSGELYRSWAAFQLNPLEMKTTQEK